MERPKTRGMDIDVGRRKCCGGCGQPLLLFDDIGRLTEHVIVWPCDGSLHREALDWEAGDVRGQQVPRFKLLALAAVSMAADAHQLVSCFDCPVDPVTWSMMNAHTFVDLGRLQLGSHIQVHNAALHTMRVMYGDNGGRFPAAGATDLEPTDKRFVLVGSASFSAAKRQKATSDVRAQALTHGCRHIFPLMSHANCDVAMLYLRGTGPMSRADWWQELGKLDPFCSFDLEYQQVPFLQFGLPLEEATDYLLLCTRKRLREQQKCPGAVGRLRHAMQHRAAVTTEINFSDCLMHKRDPRVMFDLRPAVETKWSAHKDKRQNMSEWLNFRLQFA